MSLRLQQGYLLRSRALLLGCLGFVFLFAAQLGGRYYFDLPLMQKLVAAADSKDKLRVEKALAQRLAVYASRVTDNAIWTDAYEFVLQPNDTFLVTNFDRRTLVDNELSGVIFLDNQGDIVWQYGVGFGLNAQTDELLAEPPIDSQQLKQLFQIPSHQALDGKFEARAGYVPTESGPLVFSAAPIFPTSFGNQEGFSAGTLIMWAWLDDAYFQALAEQTKLDLSATYLPLGAASLGDRWHHLLARSSELRQPDNRLSWLLFDVSGAPIVLLHLQFDALGVEHRLLSSSMLIGVAAAVFLLLVLALIVRSSLIRPLEDLGYQMSEITASGSYEERLKIDGYIELQHLARQFNLLLEEVGRQQDIARKKHAKLHLVSISDGLTGLANRRYLDQFMDETWAKARDQRTTFSLILVDVDHFKKYNDHYGHAAGDMVLKQVAQLLQSYQPDLDALTARYGGEEFCMVILGASYDAISALCGSICSVVFGQGIVHEASPLGCLSASVGAASVFVADPLLNNLNTSNALRLVFKAADQALYEAKNSGRNSYRMGAIDNI